MPSPTGDNNHIAKMAPDRRDRRSSAIQKEENLKRLTNATTTLWDMLSPSPRRPMWCMSTVVRLHCFIVYRCKPVLARQPSDRNLLCLSLDGCAGSYRHWRLSCLASASTASWFFSTGWCGVEIKFTDPLGSLSAAPPGKHVLAGRCSRQPDVRLQRPKKIYPYRTVKPLPTEI